MNQDYHYNHNAETYLLCGDALGRAMVELKGGKVEYSKANHRAQMSGLSGLPEPLLCLFRIPFDSTAILKGITQRMPNFWIIHAQLGQHSGNRPFPRSSDFSKLFQPFLP